MLTHKHFLSAGLSNALVCAQCHLWVSFMNSGGMFCFKRILSVCSSNAFVIVHSNSFYILDEYFDFNDSYDLGLIGQYTLYSF